jgi:hypothetical protein
VRAYLALHVGLFCRQIGLVLRVRQLPLEASARGGVFVADGLGGDLGTTRDGGGARLAT